MYSIFSFLWVAKWPRCNPLGLASITQQEVDSAPVYTNFIQAIDNWLQNYDLVITVLLGGSGFSSLR